MAHPKKRMSPVRSANRRRQIGLDLPATTRCPQCHTLMVKHKVCPTCGQYKGREVVAVSDKA
ncbi:50S ribosomal protein L32 [Patescibacteria group bacterium]|nr:50S ribosomal protein L32 [Patescibacteria group bacterium]